jgi:hypothetical protein
METFVVRVFVADDVDDVAGTLERPGGPTVVFRDERELIGLLRSLVGRSSRDQIPVMDPTEAPGPEVDSFPGGAE